MFIFLPQTTSCERNISGGRFNEPSNGGKSILNIHWKDWCWSWCFNTLATYCKELTHQKRPWCWERLKAGGEGDNRGWDGWMASPTWCTWVWASSGVGYGQGSLVCYSPLGCKELDVTERLNWIECFMCMDSIQWMFYSWEWKLW